MPIGGLIAGGLGAVGSIGSSLIQSSAAKDASAAQTALGQQALQQQQQLGQQGYQTLLDMFKQAQGIGQPLIDQGRSLTSSVVPTLQALLTPGANQTATLSQIPGFQFAQDWGQKAVSNQGTTLGLGGNTLKAGADYATGVAQQGFQGIVDRLLGTAGLGINAQMGPTNALIGGAINTGNSAFSNLNQNAGMVGNTLQGIGNAQASGILGSANALAGGLQGATGSASNALFLSKLLGNGGASAPAASGGGIYGSQPLTGADLAQNNALFPGYGTG